MKRGFLSTGIVNNMHFATEESPREAYDNTRNKSFGLSSYATQTKIKARSLINRAIINRESSIVNFTPLGLKQSESKTSFQRTNFSSYKKKIEKLPLNIFDYEM